MQLKKMKILVVDDDPFVRDLVGYILESDGYQVVKAKNGAEAVNFTSTHPEEIHLIISDMNMDRMDGIELIRILRKNEQNKDIPIIVLTVNHEVSVALEAINSGADDYLLKDENIQETLLYSIQGVMEKHELKKQNMALMEELEKKNRELEKIAFIDGLTGIPNRRYFDDKLREEWNRALISSLPFSMIMIDIDYFKNYNDTCGHLEGDSCLKEVAEALKDAAARSLDFIARYGGEEFIAIFPGSDEEGSKKIAEAMQRNLADRKIPHPASAVSDVITVSIGYGTTYPAEGALPEDFVESVDKALYRAKEEGRNRIMKVG